MRYLLPTALLLTSLTLSLIVVMYAPAALEGEVEESISPEIGLLTLSVSSDEAGYPMPASGHSEPDPPPPPTVTVEARIKPGSTWYSSTGTCTPPDFPFDLGFEDCASVFITPDDELEIRWTSANASSCTSSFGGSNTSGSADIIPGLNPGGSTTYEVSCSGVGGTASDSVTVEVPELLVDFFTVDQSIVRSGDTTVLQWRLRLSESLSATPAGDLSPYSYACEIRGATPDDGPYMFDAADNNGEGAITTRPLTNKFVNSLSCDANTYQENEVEVVPAFREG